MDGNLEYYKVFYYVAECKSLTRAAEALAISQPAVSQSMKMLEEVLDVKLFLRTSRGIRLTPEGEILYEYVKSGYEQISHGEQVLKKLLNLEAGELHVGASDMTLRYYLLPFLEKYHERYPKIKVKITNGPTPETLQKMEEGRFDIGLVSTPFEKREGIEVLQVREIEDVFVAGRKYTQLKNHMTDFHELPDYPVICLEKNTSTRKYMDDLLAQNHVILNPEFELATSDMIVQFALRNLGIGCVVRDFAKEYIESGKLFELRFNKMIPKRQICVVTNHKMPMSAAARGLLELLTEKQQEK
ncbi:MAG: LysR family transcriptional regulator [Lachnospiraceae bacterium]|nr:LysR family transcriptional regulator [Lachnospiraceae bacterium]